MGLGTDLKSLAAIGVGTIGALGATALFAANATDHHRADGSSCISVRSLGSTVAIDFSNLEDSDSRAVVISPDVRVEAECIALREEVARVEQRVRVRVREARERAEEARLRADQMRLEMDEIRVRAEELQIEPGAVELDFDEAELRESLESLRELEGLKAFGVELDLDIDEIVEQALEEARAEIERKRERGGGN